MTQCYIQVDDDDAEVECDNCEWTGVASDLEMISDIEDRINAGCEVPAGQCPSCSGLAYLTEPDKWTPSGRLKVEKNRTQKLTSIVRLFVDQVITLPNGETTPVDIPRLREDAAKLLAEIDKDPLL